MQVAMIAYAKATAEQNTAMQGEVISGLGPIFAMMPLEARRQEASGVLNWFVQQGQAIYEQTGLLPDSSFYYAVFGDGEQVGVYFTEETTA